PDQVLQYLARMFAEPRRPARFAGQAGGGVRKRDHGLAGSVLGGLCRNMAHRAARCEYGMVYGLARRQNGSDNDACILQSCNGLVPGELADPRFDLRVDQLAIEQTRGIGGGAIVRYEVRTAE